MKNYFYCEDCDELIHKDGICPECNRCRECGSEDLEHTEDIEEDNENYERVKELCDALHENMGVKKNGD